MSRIIPLNGLRRPEKPALMTARLHFLLAAALFLPQILHASRSNSADIDAQLSQIQQDFNVRVHYRYDPDSFFPAHWRTPSIAATGDPIEQGQVVRMIPLIREFCQSHPASVIRSNLTDIYLLGTLTCSGGKYGSSYHGQCLYITCQKIEQGYTRSFLSQRLHSEFSSILFNRYTFPTAQWEQTNSPLFSYSGNGFEMLSNPLRYSHTTTLRADGFLLNYSRSSLENDFNMIAAWLFSQPEELETISRQYSKIRQKQTLAETFYKSISPLYSFD